jgi:hypothetical protein
LIRWRVAVVVRGWLAVARTGPAGSGRPAAVIGTSRCSHWVLTTVQPAGTVGSLPGSPLVDCGGVGVFVGWAGVAIRTRAVTWVTRSPSGWVTTVPAVTASGAIHADPDHADAAAPLPNRAPAMFR